MSKTHILYLEIIIFIVIPVILMTYGRQFLFIRYFMFGFGALYCFWRITKSGAKLSDLGVSTTNSLLSIQRLIVPTLFIILFASFVFYFTPLKYLSILLGYNSTVSDSLSKTVLAYILYSVPIQELIFRGYITYRLKEAFTSQNTIIIWSVILFTFAHLQFYSPLLLIITATTGYLYIKNYQKYQNLLGPILSHALIGSFIIIIRSLWFPTL